MDSLCVCEFQIAEDLKIFKVENNCMCTASLDRQTVIYRNTII